MSATIDTLFTDAMTLPDDSRLKLAERLISTVQDEPCLEAEQLQDVQRRIEEVRLQPAAFQLKLPLRIRTVRKLL